MSIIILDTERRKQMIKTIIFIILFILSCIKSIIEFYEEWELVGDFMTLTKIIILKCIIWGILYLIIF